MQPTGQSNPQEPQDELMNLMTIMYITLQEALNDPEDMSSSYGKLRKFMSDTMKRVTLNSLGASVELQPPLTEFMLTATVKLRWDEQNVLPQTQVRKPLAVFMHASLLRLLDIITLLEVHLASFWWCKRPAKS